jgi:hypothetical protein
MRDVKEAVRDYIERDVENVTLDTLFARIDCMRLAYQGFTETLDYPVFRNRHSGFLFPFLRSLTLEIEEQKKRDEFKKKLEAMSLFSQNSYNCFIHPSSLFERHTDKIMREFKHKRINSLKPAVRFVLHDHVVYALDKLSEEKRFESLFEPKVVYSPWNPRPLVYGMSWRKAIFSDNLMNSFVARAHPVNVLKRHIEEQERKAKRGRKKHV